LEKFRNFVLKSGFLGKFEIEATLVETLKTNDTALLEFGFRWLRFALFHEPILKVKAAQNAR
jgi:hypothetical protein